MNFLCYFVVVVMPWRPSIYLVPPRDFLLYLVASMVSRPFAFFCVSMFPSFPTFTSSTDVTLCSFAFLFYFDVLYLLVRLFLASTIDLS